MVFAGAIRDSTLTIVLGLAAILTATGCASRSGDHTRTPETQASPTGEAAVTPPADWRKLMGHRVSMWLPGSFVGGNVDQDLGLIERGLRNLGPDGNALADEIAANPSLFLFWAFDASSSGTVAPTTVNITRTKILSTATMDSVLDEFQSVVSRTYRGTVISREKTSIAGYEAGRVIVDFDSADAPRLTAWHPQSTLATARALVYLLQSGNTLYELTFATSSANFEQLLSSFEEAASTFKTELMPYPGHSSSSASAGCTKDGSVSIQDAPIDETLHDGDELTVTIQYDTPGCDHVSGTITGTHQSGSPWYTYWCVIKEPAAPCDQDVLDSSFSLADVTIPPSGTLKLRATPGIYPPRSLSSTPTFEGFRPCYVSIIFTSDKDASARYEYDAGVQCTGSALAGVPAAVPTLSAPTEAPQVAVHCGDSLTARFSGTAPLGRVFHDGDQLPAMVVYSAPGCDSVSAYFDGFFAASTPWCEYWLTQSNAQAATACRSGGISSSIPGDAFALSQPAGVLRFIAKPGVLPPSDLSSVPNLEGMRYCGVLLRFYSRDRLPQDVFLGDQCYFGPRLP